ncbi:MAG: AAA family ATPase [Dehalococcoidia bacterium]
MADTPIQLVGPEGEPLGKLRLGALALIAEAEGRARAQGLAKSTALPAMLRVQLEGAGYQIEDAELSKAVRALNELRRGSRLPCIEVVIRSRKRRVRLPDSFSGIDHSDQNAEKQMGRNSDFMGDSQNATRIVEFFELKAKYPNETARARYERLVGLDDHKARLLIELEMLLFPEKLQSWSRKHHNRKILHLCELQRDRVPLVLLEGDVGTGKTVLAETVGDALARRIGNNAHVHILKINTQVRGTGQVGEMSDLIVQAFTQAKAYAAKHQGEPVLLLLDEADALAASRDIQQMHHEDKAGLNTPLQRLDNLRSTGLPIAVIFITNRPDALDPAIRRRAALDLFFDRPNDEVRAEIIKRSVPELNLTKEQIDELVSLTGENGSNNRAIRFTASDITEKLLAGALREAYSQDRELRAEDLIAQARKIQPAPRMGSM